MKLHLIHDVFDAAGLQRMTKDQLMALAATPAGKQLAKAITSFLAGDHATAAVLELATRSVSAGTVTLAKAAGVTFPGMLATELAITKGELFFDALEAAAGNNPGKVEAPLAYLRSAGALPVRQDASPLYYSFKVFGRSAALCFAEARTRSGDFATINIEGAIGSGAPGRVAYDWQSKLIVQLSRPELFQVLALFEQKIAQLRLEGHGRGHDKFIHFDIQDGHYFVKLAQRGRFAVAVPVTPADAIRIVSLLYKQILRNEPHLNVENISALVDRMAPMLASAHPRP